MADVASFKDKVIQVCELNHAFGRTMCGWSVCCKKLAEGGIDGHIWKT